MYKGFVSILFTLAVAAVNAHATPTFPNPPMQTLQLGGKIQINRAATESLSLSGPVYIKNLVIQAQGYASNSTIEVMVNGQVKGTIQAPGVDPSYIVTVGETARSIEFRHRDGGPMQILSILGTVADISLGPTYGGTFNGSRAEVIRFTSTVMADLETLSSFASPADEHTYLFPIKRNAGLVYVMATAHGTLSKETLTQLVALCDQIAFAQPYLDQLMQLDSAFNTVVDLMTVRETLVNLMN
jgi:hypothetical protein